MKTRASFAKSFPHEYMQAHEYCEYLIEDMNRTLLSAERARIFDVSIKPPHSEDLERLKDKNGEELLKAIEDIGFGHLVEDIIIGTAIPALVSDMLLFLREALSCSKRNLLTPCFALLRKPLKENLFYIEWMLTDRQQFLAKFRSDKWYTYDPCRPTGDEADEAGKHQRRIELIAGAMDKTALGRWANPEMIYDLRYNKAVSFGLEYTFEQAMHLVTKFREFKTSDTNFNFIFAGSEGEAAQWRHLYNILPLVLLHAHQVVNALIRCFAKPRYKSPDLANIRTKVGFLCSFAVTDYWDWLGNPWSALISSDEYQNTRCKRCGKRLLEYQMDMRIIFEDNDLLCCRCAHPLRYLKYTFLRKLVITTAETERPTSE